MREILTFLALLLVVVLAAALAGPYFVDWSAQRPLFEARIGEALGRAVTLKGPIDLKLLPSPRLVLGEFALADAPGQPGLSGQGLRIELAPMPLLSGELRFTDASLEQPVLRLALQEGGAVALPDLSAAALRQMRFEHVTLAHATVILEDSARREVLRFAGLDLSAEAQSLAGPFKGAGQVLAAQGPLAFRFSTGALEKGRLRLKAVVDEAGSSPRSEIDGAFSLDDRRRAVFDGTAGFSGHLAKEDRADAPDALPWRLSGSFHADAATATASALDVRLGGADGAFAATGTGEVVFGDRAAATLSLAAKQLDLDKVAGLQEALAHWLGDPALGAQLPFALSVDFATPLATLGGQGLTDASISVALAAGQPVTLHLAASGPGRSTVTLAGAVETGAATGFKGQVEVEALDPPRLADWLDGFSAPLAARLRALPFRSLAASGEVAASRVGFSVKDMKLKLDRSAFAGAMAYTSAVWNEKARLFADVSSDALDLDAAPDLTGAPGFIGDTDLSLRLEARAFKLARFGDGVVDAGRLALKLSKTGPATQLENFSLARFGGADVTAQGRWDGVAGRIDAVIDAARLDDAATLLRRIAPGAATEFLARRAGALSPAKLVLSAEAAGPAAALSALALDGTAGGTRVTGKWKPDGSGNLTMEAPDAAILMRQIGFEPPPMAAPAGKAKLAVSLKARADKTLETVADATAAGAQIGFRGSLAGLPDAPQAAGTLKLESADLVPLAALLGGALPDGGAGVAGQLEARLALSAQALALTGLAGTVAGAKVAGDLSLAGPRGNLAGALKIDRLGLPALAALAFGSPAAAKTGAVWSEQKFLRGLAGTPPAAVALDIGAFDLWPGLPAQHATLRLETGAGFVALRDMALELAGGQASGDVTLRRDGADAALLGRIAFNGLALQIPALSGIASGQLDVTATGQSAAALAGSLAGTGRVLMSRTAVPRADPLAVGRVLALVDKGGFAVDESSVRQVLERELDRAPLAMGEQDFDVSMAAGSLRLAAKANGAGLRIVFDLRNFVLDERLRLRETAMPKEWTGELPQIEVLWKGLLAAPQREVEAGGFTNGLAAREIARDTARILALEADIRERAAFNRRLKGMRKLRQDEIDYQHYLEEQARLAAEAEARRKAEEARLVVEEAKRAAEEARRAAIEEQRRALEAARLEREQKLAEAKRLAEEKAKQEEETRLTAERAKRAAEEARRAAIEEQRRALEAARQEREQKNAEAKRLADENLKQEQAEKVRRMVDEILRSGTLQSLPAVELPKPAPVNPTDGRATPAP